MSCVVGVVEHGGVCMGADSAMTVGNSVHIATGGTGKLVRVGEMLIALVGNANVAQVLRNMDAPEREGDERTYIDREFVPAFVTALRDAGVRAPKGDSGYFEGGLLIAIGTHLYLLPQDLSATECARGYAALGVGAEVALGSLHTSDGAPADDRVRLALEAATEFCDGVRPPFVIEWTRPPLHVAA